MVNTHTGIRLSRILTLSVLAGAGATPVLAQDEGVIEEIVVTGSYLRRTTADSPSPLSVVTKADIDELGAVDAERRLAGRRRVAVLRADGAPRQFGDDVRVIDGGHVALAHEVEHAPVPVRVEAVAVLARVRAEPDRDVVGGAQRGLLLGALAVAHAEF